MLYPSIWTGLAVVVRRRNFQTAITVENRLAFTQMMQASTVWEEQLVRNDYLIY